MAMTDYGCCVKKNGKIITKEHNFDNNLTTLSNMEIPHYVYPDEEDGGWSGFCVIGDEDFLIEFYKDAWSFLEKKNKYDHYVFETYPLYINDGFKTRKAPYRFTHKGIDFEVKPINPVKGSASVFLMKFTYKNDKYEILFGYGVDRPGFMLSKKSYFKPYRQIWVEPGQVTHKYKNHNDRSVDRFVTKWCKED